MERLAIIADVAGPADYHLGDEAMLEANLTMLRRLVPDLAVTVFSRDPAWTSRRYGVEAVLCPKDFANLTAEQERAIQESRGLLVSGGGNLSDTWPDKILERTALMRLAKDRDKPVAIVGQTIGPDVTGERAVMLSEVLPWAAWVGVRDDASAAVARRLGVPADRIHRQIDDAFLLSPTEVDDARGDPFRHPVHPPILVTIDASFAGEERQSALIAMASQLDSLVAATGGTLVFVPHRSGSHVDMSQNDLAAARALAPLLRSSLTVLEPWQPAEVRWLVEQAALVISSRYHPIVFATAALVPSLAIHQDDYTRIKLRGALSPAGLEGCCMSLDDAERGGLFTRAVELWHRRESVRARLAARYAEEQQTVGERWRAVCRVLQLPATPAAGESHRRQSHARKANPVLATAATLSDEQWSQFEADGYLRVGRIVDDDQLAALRQRMDDIMLGRLVYPSLQTQLDTGGRYEDLPDPTPGLIAPTLAYRKLQGLEVDPLVLAVIRHDLFRAFSARIYGAHASVSIFRAMIMNKPAGQGTHLPWHQDAGEVWKLDRDPILTSWIALDPATRANGCVQVIPGTHRLGLLSKQGSTISDAHASQYCPDDKIEFLEIEAGEALVLHNWLLHRSGVNTTNGPRRALSACYMDGRTLSTLTGRRFPLVFGEEEDVESALPFVSEASRQRREAAGSAAEAARYATSLVADNAAREEMRRTAEEYALALEREVARLRQMT